MANGTHTLEVWGDLACFTRPEMKVERFSYPVITPSAARGIFDAIYWDGKRDGNASGNSPFAGFGNLVILDHGAQTFSLYGDLLEIAVKRGARVERGQGIGSVGAAPAGPPGLYFELRVDGRPVDPLQWLKKQ